MSNASVPTFGNNNAANGPVFDMPSCLSDSTGKVPPSGDLPNANFTHREDAANGPTLTGTPAGWIVQQVGKDIAYIPYWTKEV